jgi:hypothetical protein
VQNERNKGRSELTGMEIQAHRSEECDAIERKSRKEVLRAGNKNPLPFLNGKSF